MGSRHLTGYPQTLAVCDVDGKHLARALKRVGGKCDGYTDFRRVLDRSDIDTVHVPTPPHWHALISIAAALAGKDVYCEKPMSHTIREGQVVIETIRQYGRVFQINTLPWTGSVPRQLRIWTARSRALTRSCLTLPGN